MAIQEPVYTTREIIKRALDQGEVARNNRNIDRCIATASRNVEGLCHRIFYPHIDTKYFDWPNQQRAPAWRLWLDESNLISLTSVVSGGTTISLANVLLEPNVTGPPYNRLELNIGTSAAFGGGSTYQRSITLAGLWGHSDDHYAAGLTIEALDASETGVDVNAAASAELGVGSIIKIDDERMLVTDRTMLDTGINVGGAGLTNAKSDTLLAVSDGTQFAVGEVLLIGSERVFLTDIAGNNLIIERAFEGSASAAHAVGDDIYAARTLTVARGAVGSTAATHLTGATVYAWSPPAGIRQLVSAEAEHELMQEQTGWFRTMSASSVFGGTAKRAASLEALVDLRDMVYRTYGRKARTRTI